MTEQCEATEDATHREAKEKDDEGNLTAMEGLMSSIPAEVRNSMNLNQRHSRSSPFHNAGLSYVSSFLYGSTLHNFDIEGEDLHFAHNGRSNMTNTCKRCGKVEKRKMDICARCKNVIYCSRRCQVKDWKEHKSQCVAKEENHDAD